MFPDFAVSDTAVVKNIHKLICCSSLKGMFDFQFIFMLSLYADFFIQLVSRHWIPTKPEAQPNTEIY
jgi:hypothetical protein